MDYRQYVVQNPKYMRPEELRYLCGDCSKAKALLHWTPAYTFDAMIDELINQWTGQPAA